jgi:hypothetical protein
VIGASASLRGFIIGSAYQPPAWCAPSPRKGEGWGGGLLGNSKLQLFTRDGPHPPALIRGADRLLDLMARLRRFEGLMVYSRGVTSPRITPDKCRENTA